MYITRTPRPKVRKRLTLTLAINNYYNNKIQLEIDTNVITLQQRKETEIQYVKIINRSSTNTLN